MSVRSARSSEALSDPHRELAAGVLKQVVEDYRLYPRLRGGLLTWIKSKRARLFLDLVGVSADEFIRRLRHLNRGG